MKHYFISPVFGSVVVMACPGTPHIPKLMVEEVVMSAEITLQDVKSF